MYSAPGTPSSLNGVEGEVPLSNTELDPLKSMTLKTAVGGSA
jgi:hypothetical protein